MTKADRLARAFTDLVLLIQDARQLPKTLDGYEQAKAIANELWEPIRVRLEQK